MKLDRSILVLMVSVAACGHAASAQAPTTQNDGRAAETISPEGDWVAVYPAGSPGLQMAVHFRRRNGVMVGTLDIPDRGAFAAPLANVEAEGRSLSYDVPLASGHYTGVWNATKQAFAGQFKSPYGSGPLTLARGSLPQTAVVDLKAAPSTEFTYTPGPAAHARVGPTLPVGRCVNMANMLEAPKEGDWGTPVAEDDFSIIKTAGFSTVRIPVSWSTHANVEAPYTIDPSFLRRVHHVVDLASAAGLNVILNVQHYNELMSAPAANTARFAGLWRQIAASFASAPPSVWFELLNEPHDKLISANLTSTLAPALAAVRSTNPTRPVLIGGENWSSLASLSTLSLPDDPYVVPTFHYYEPFAFTSQGATWIPNPPPFGRGYGSVADKVELDRDLVAMKSYMAKTGRVPVMGEYGAIDDVRLPLDQRVRYYRAISAAFASIGVQGCAWGYRNSFRLRDGNHWLPGMVESITTTTTR